jgi:hypothetical protein
LDAVALGDSGSQAERAGVRRRTGSDFALRAFVADVDLAGVVEIDVQGGISGVIVQRHELVSAVVDVHHEEVGVFEGSAIVGR